MYYNIARLICPSFNMEHSWHKFQCQNICNNYKLLNTLPYEYLAVHDIIYSYVTIDWYKIGLEMRSH